MDADSRIRELEQKLKTSEGLRIHYKRRALRRSYGIFNGNYLILCRALDRMETLEYMMPMLANDEVQIQQHNLDVAIVLHNFLAGAATLREHTKVFRDEVYSESPFGAEYDKEFKRTFENSPIVQFVLKLRNYTLHEQLPVTGSWVSFKNTNNTSEEWTAYVSLNVTKLREHSTREHKKWNAKSREYLNSLDDKVKVRAVTDQYKAVVEDFYKWFAQRQEEIHGQAYA